MSTTELIDKLTIITLGTPIMREVKMCATPAVMFLEMKSFGKNRGNGDQVNVSIVDSLALNLLRNTKLLKSLKISVMKRKLKETAIKD